MNNDEIKNCVGGSKKYFSLLLGILSVFLIILTISAAVDIWNKIKEGKYIGQEIETKNTISVSDIGEIYAKPDLAVVAFSVVNESATVSGSIAENAKKMNTVIDFMKKQGVEDKDLKTASFNIYPRYEWSRETVCLFPPCTGEKRVLTGYEVQQSLEVKIRDMAKIGDIIQGATDSGANQVGDLSFTIDKQDEIKNQAREQAIEKAKAKAKELAGQLGVKLARIVNFSESGTMPIPYPYDTMLGKGGGETSSEAPSVETGENKISVTVSITYEIQ
jgi:hypothetical protein